MTFSFKSVYEIFVLYFVPLLSTFLVACRHLWQCRMSIVSTCEYDVVGNSWTGLSKELYAHVFNLMIFPLFTSKLNEFLNFVLGTWYCRSSFRPKHSSSVSQIWSIVWAIYHLLLTLFILVIKHLNVEFQYHWIS